MAYTIHQGDVLEVLRGMEDESVQCVVTSPPYWGLRDYGTGTWEGGDKGCDHIEVSRAPVHESKSTLGIPAGGGDCRIGENNQTHKKDAKQFADLCGKCGARRVDQQLGLEATPFCGGALSCGECYVCRMVEVFREVRRVLRSDGVCFINMGDSYASSGTRSNNNGEGASTMGWDGQRKETLNKVAGMKLPAINLITSESSGL